MNEHSDNLTNEEFNDFKDIVGEVINKLIGCADKHNIDRDSFLKYFADMFSAMCEISTFEHYAEEVNND